MTTIGRVTGEKPPARGRVYYLLGGTLPPSYRAWVAADNTARGWRYREALRLALLAAPFAVVFLLLPGKIEARATMAICIVVAAAVTGVVSAGFFRNRRLVQHGLPPVVAAEEDPERDEQPAALDAATPPGARTAHALERVGEGVRRRENPGGLGDRA